MKTTQKHSIILILVLLMGIQTVQAIQVPLGTIDFSNPVNPNQQSGWNLADVVDGNIVTTKNVSSGWANFGLTDRPNYLQVNVNLPEINLDPRQSIDYYTFSISLYYAWDETHSASAFTLSSSNDGINFFQITDILSASTNNENTELTFDSEGNFTATQPNAGDPLEVHNVEFNVARDITHFRFNVGPYAGWTGLANGNVTLSELEGVATAEVIPESTTYALIAGLACFAWVFYIRRRRLQSQS